MNMTVTTRRLLIIIGLTAVTMSIHYGAFPHGQILHSLHRRLCYVPIVLASLWFGLAGGLLTSAGISLLLAPYIVLQWDAPGGGVVNEFIEIFFYNAIGIIAGALIDSQRRARRSEEQLSARLQAAERLSALGEAAAALAHEVRNPLGAIRGSAEILQGASVPEAKRAEFLSLLVREANRLNQVVENFLRLSRPLSLKVQEVDLNDEVESVVSLLQPEAERSGVRVSADYDRRIPRIRMDPDRMRQVFMNALINGIQAMPEGGVLSLRTGLSANGWGAGSRDVVTVTISDTGPGISRENLKNVFTPFFTTKPDGTGLGLAVSKRIVDEHGGHIAIESAEGRGTTVSIALPPAPPAEGHDTSV